MGGQAHQAIAERVHAQIDQALERGEAAARLGHLARPLDQEIIVHPEGRAGVRAAAMRLVLRDLVGVMDLAVVDPAGMDIETRAQIFLAHHRAFEMPARRASAPGRIPFHLAILAGRRFAPDREILRMALAGDGIDPPFALVIGDAGEAAVIGHGRHVEIKAAVEFVAMKRRDLLGKGDHLGDVIGRERKARRFADVEVLQILLEHRGVMGGDIPDAGGARARGRFHLVVAGIGVRGQVTDIGDVDDVGEGVALPRQHAAQRVGEDIGPEVADMRVIIDGRAAGIDAHLRRVDRPERFERTGEAVVEDEIGHVPAHSRATARLAKGGDRGLPARVTRRRAPSIVKA